MRKVLSAFALCLFISWPWESLQPALAQEAAPSKTALHDSCWRIEYPSLVFPWKGKEEYVLLTLRKNYAEEADKLKVILEYSSNANGPNDDFLKSARIRMSLHCVGAQETRATQTTVGWGPGFGGTRGVTYHLAYDFPWGANILAEAWIQVELPGQTYWCEVPYGFTRNPRDRLAPARSNGGPPVMAAEMTKRRKEDKLVGWACVSYDYAKIQNNWRYQLIMSNAVDACAEIVLYRDDAAIAKSKYLWRLDTPKTALSIKESKGDVVKGFGTAIRLHDDGLRRSDTFRVHYFPSTSRGWGTIYVIIGDKEYARVIPSSLYKSGHGTMLPASISSP
jgi:hypothetical protein